MKSLHKHRLSTPFKIVLSFLFIILVGSLLLNLPISQTDQSQASYFDHLFAAVSMICVTGLYTQPVYLTYNTFGQFVCMVLIKTGGLGLLTLVAAIFIGINHRINHSQTVLLSESLNRFDQSQFPSFIIMILKMTSTLEAIGAFILSFVFVPQFGWLKGIFNSFFISISAFNNAGFDNIGPTSLINYAQNPVINIVVPLLIIAGGLGFSVWFEVLAIAKSAIRSRFRQDRIPFKEVSVHTRMVLTVTIFLLVAGTLAFLLTEWSNPKTIGSHNLIDKLQVSFFQSATMRTAGFSTIDYTQMILPSFIIAFVLMFVGGSPGSTAGGVKTSSIMLIILLIKNEIFQEDSLNYHHHSISKNIARKALVIGIMFVILTLLSSFLISIFDMGVKFEYIVFEVISALATVGVSANLTASLSRLSQTILMLLMIIGRIGPITFFAALQVNKRQKVNVKYAKGHVLIG